LFDDSATLYADFYTNIPQDNVKDVFN
jgi:hypothetical protein